MTARRVTAHSETELMRWHHDCLAAELQSHRSRIPRQTPPPRVEGGGSAASPAASCRLPPRAESIRIARDFTGITLRRWGMAALADDAGLVVSELVTNALRHGLGRTGGRSAAGAPGAPGEMPITLRLLAQPPYLMCMVADPSREIPLRRDADADAETGRGLHVIESCCSRWGWNLLDEGGKVVWALLPAS